MRSTHVIIPRIFRHTPLFVVLSRTGTNPCSDRYRAVWTEVVSLNRFFLIFLWSARVWLQPRPGVVSVKGNVQTLLFLHTIDLVCKQKASLSAHTKART